MTKILLIRHGHVEGIKPERFRGLAAAEICADLNDIDYGAWQFKSFAEAKAQDPALFAAWFATPDLVRFPHGESLQDLAGRAANALAALARTPCWRDRGACKLR